MEVQNDLNRRTTYAAPQSPTFTISSSDSSYPLVQSYHTEFPASPPGMAQTALEAPIDEPNEALPRQRKRLTCNLKYSPCAELSILLVNLLVIVSSVLVMCGFTLYPKPPIVEVSTFAFTQFNIQGVGNSGNAYSSASGEELKKLATGMGWDKIFSKVASQSPPYRMIWATKFNMTLRSSSSLSYPADAYNWQLKFPGPSHLIAAGTLPTFNVPRQGYPSTLDFPIVSNRTFESLPMLLKDVSTRSLLMACNVMEIVSTDVQFPRNPSFVAMTLSGKARIEALKAFSWTGLITQEVPAKPQRIAFACPVDQVSRLLNQ